MDLQKMIEAAIDDEASDVKKYMDLADLADEHFKDYGYGSILRDIAHEEQTHHKHLKAIWEDMHKHGLIKEA